MYKTFTRTWWKEASRRGIWPDNLEPHAGRRTYRGEYDTEEEAREACQEWNSTHKPGRYSRKMEYDH